jgi:hypothetical protein
MPPEGRPFNSRQFIVKRTLLIISIDHDEPETSSEANPRPQYLGTTSLVLSPPLGVNLIQAPPKDP